MKIGYKGLDYKLCPNAGNQKAKEIAYDLTQVQTINSDKELKLCTDTGFHYCNNLIDVFEYYPLNKNHRYFEIEILGEYLDGAMEKYKNKIEELKIKYQLCHI